MRSTGGCNVARIDEGGEKIGQMSAGISPWTFDVYPSWRTCPIFMQIFIGAEGGRGGTSAVRSMSSAVFPSQRGRKHSWPLSAERGWSYGGGLSERNGVHRNASDVVISDPELSHPSKAVSTVLSANAFVKFRTRFWSECSSGVYPRPGKSWKKNKQKIDIVSAKLRRTTRSRFFFYYFRDGRSTKTAKIYFRFVDFYISIHFCTDDSVTLENIVFW